MSALVWPAAAALLAWLYLLFGRSGFWRAGERLGRPPGIADWPSVAAIVPARNEASTIAETVRSIAGQDYPGALRLVVIDDSSADGTAERARAAAQGIAGVATQIVAAPPLAPGWTGKLWALQQGVQAADASGAPDVYWFTDADIVHGPQVLRGLAAKAAADDRDLVSLMVRLRTESFWERWIVPAFIFFFQMLYPFPAVNDPHDRTAAAAGGCILIRRTALDRAGGIAALKDALIDDCTLAAKVQAAGGRLWLGLADDSRSLRGAETLGPLWRMVKRTAFTQLNYSPLLLFGTLLGLAVTFLAPPLVLTAALLGGDLPAAALAALAYALMALAYRPTLRDYRRPAAEAVGLPVVAALYTAMTLQSALDHWRGRGSDWKGRAYARAGDAAKG